MDFCVSDEYFIIKEEDVEDFSEDDNINISASGTVFLYIQQLSWSAVAYMWLFVPYSLNFRLFK